MPNGFHGSKEDWERMVAPLRELDAGLSSFAAAHGLEVVHNYHNTPNRMIFWSRAGIERQIQISLYDDDKILFSSCAYKDEGKRRLGTNWPPVKDIPLPEFKSNLENLLIDTYQKLEAVSDDDLEPWT